MSTTKPAHVRRAMSTGGKLPTKPVQPVITDSEHEVDGDPVPTPVRSSRGRGRGHGRGRGSQGTPSMHTTVTRATKKASKKAMSDSEAGDDLADVKTSNSASEDDAEVVSTPTPSKRGPKAQTKDIEEGDVALVKHGHGRPPKAKVVKSPEIVPSDDEDEHIVPKARSSTKPWKMSKKESADEYDLDEETVQKTPEKRVVQRQRGDTIKSSAKSSAQAPWSIDSEADARRPNPWPPVMRTPKADRTRNDNADVVSPESPSPRKTSTPHSKRSKVSAQKRPVNVDSSEQESENDSEQEHPSPSKKPRQCSPELEYNPTPKTPKTYKAAIWARGFEKAEVVITSRSTRQATMKPTPMTIKGGKVDGASIPGGKAKSTKAPDSASDFFNKLPVKSPKKGHNLFVDNESLDDAAGSGEEPESDLSPMCVDSDNDRRTSRSGSPPPEYMSAKEDSIYTSSKKGKTLRAPTPYSDSEDTATGQMNDMSLQTPQRPTRTMNHYPPIAHLTDLSANPGLNEHLPHLKDVVMTYADNCSFWTGDVHKTVLGVSAYKMHPAAILYAVGLRGSLKDGVINPAHWEPSNATNIHGNGNGTSWVLAIDGLYGSRRVVVATFGTVLQSDIVKTTPSYVGSTQQVQQVILAPFEHEWTRIYRFYGTMFDKYEFNISIFGPRIMGGSGDEHMHGLQIRSWPSEKSSNSPQAIAMSNSGFVVSHAGGDSQSEGSQASRSTSSPDQSFHAMSSQTAWPVNTQIPIWDARPQFASGKYLFDGVFSIEDTFKLPKLEGEDLQHGDIALIYHSITMYAKDRTTAMGLSFGLYGAVLIGRPT